MKKRVYGRKFSRDRGARTALLRSLAVSFIRSAQIKTTLHRAKAAAPLIEHLVTLAKKGDLNSNRRIMSELAQDEVIARKLASEVKLRFGSLNSGFTRMVRVGKRVGDNATVAKLTWSREGEEVSAKPNETTREKTPQRGSASGSA